MITSRMPTDSSTDSQPQTDADGLPWTTTRLSVIQVKIDAAVVLENRESIDIFRGAIAHGVRGDH